MFKLSKEYFQKKNWFFENYVFFGYYWGNNEKGVFCYRGVNFFYVIIIDYIFIVEFRFRLI